MHLILEKIILTNFKSYNSFAIQLQHGFNCITGLNGVGKTNLLDAIYYICLCKSAFAASDKNVVAEGQSFFRIEAAFENDTIVAKYQQRKKVFECNKKPYNRLFEHVGRFPIVLAAPEDAKIIAGGSAERRKFIDTSLAQTNNTYLENLMTYNRLLRQRNAALKNMLDSKTTDKALIQAIDNQMMPLSIQLQQDRNKFIQAFSPVFQKSYATISNDREKAAIHYHSNFDKTSLKPQLEQVFKQDYYAGRSQIGIHKDNLTFELDGREVKDFASQGQTKSVLLALRLAQFDWIRQELDKTPIFLIDDIYDKLDASRVLQLLSLLSNLSIPQIVLTDTNAERLKPILEKLETTFHFIEL